jgi:hypothetical protein
MVFADADLINGLSEAKARGHEIGNDEVKRFPISILVNTGLHMLAINENIQQQLELPVVDRKKHLPQIKE